MWMLVSLALAQEVCLPSSDCDGDGYSPIQGDCDDDDGLRFPGAGEQCGTDVDDDCDNLVNEGCDRSAQQGQLWGGSACAGDGGSAGGFAALGLVPLIRRRRR